MLTDLFLNHVYGRTGFYQRQFGQLGEGARVWYPNLAIAKKDMFIGQGSQILQNSRIQTFPQEGLPHPKIRIGEHCYLGYHLSILAGADVMIGNRVLMASDILITTEAHGMDPESEIPYMDQPLSVAPVSIGDGCWLGEKVMVMPGVTIGEKSIIGAGSIVTKDIPAFSIAVGNPARVIKKYHFDTHTWERV